jgi:hypothetical protein
MIPAADALGVPVHAHTIGNGGEVHDPAQRWQAAYGVEPDGAVLIRPDGHVAWRRPSCARDPRGELESALRTMLRE